LFDILLHAPWGGPLAGVNVLDGFAGTGALGLEALSRGAASAWFIEQDRAALTALRANVAACGAGVVLAADMLRPPPGQPCGLVFLDPPYGQGLLPLALAALRKAHWLAPDATIVAEAAAGETPDLGTLLAERRHGAGRVTIWSVADHVEG
jgi:16S rRNA (guanine966-N2)-methyltransferase